MRLMCLGASNFGGLFSVTFFSTDVLRTFFDTLECHKEPSLSMSFMLTFPYTARVHYGEMDWAASYGVEEGLVQVTIRTEER